MAPSGDSRFEQCVDGVNAVGPPDLLSLIHAARVIADRDFDDSPSREQELRRQLGLEVEADTTKPDALDDVAAEYFVGRLHVGEPRAEEDVGERGEQPVAETSAQWHARRRF